MKLLVLGVVLVGLGAIIGFSLSRELGGSLNASQPTGPSAVRAAQRPALSADEQAYVEALWPIHTDVEVAAERVALGTIFYKGSDLDSVELQSRLQQALVSYRSADGRLQALRPPPSLLASHQAYVSAVGLFEQSAIEMLKMFADGREEHLQAGYPLYLDGANKIRDVGGNFWPDEFPPN